MDKTLPLMGEYWAGALGMLPNVGWHCLFIWFPGSRVIPLGHAALPLIITNHTPLASTLLLLCHHPLPLHHRPSALNLHFHAAAFPAHPTTFLTWFSHILQKPTYIMYITPLQYI